MERLLEMETRLSGEMVSLRDEFRQENLALRENVQTQVASIREEIEKESVSMRAELSKRLILFDGHIESMNRDVLALKTQQREILDVMREWLRKAT
jgi:hypothetical protein